MWPHKFLKDLCGISKETWVPEDPIATKWLKDGDVVHVDAKKGQVKRI